MSVSIRLNHISKKMGPNQALHDVVTVFESGRLHGLIGSEGAGKTTLFRLLLQLLEPNTGTIEFFDSSNQNKLIPFESIREQISYMPSRQSLYADLSISEHLDFFRDLYRVPEDEYKKKRAELLHITRLDKFQDRKAGELSGGMYKKLGLMCSLLQSPLILLLDEPTNGVDPISRREFWDLLYRLLNPNRLIIIATAYMDEAERCEEVHLFNQGKFLIRGEPRTLLEKDGVKSFDDFFLKRTPQGGIQ